MTGDLRVVQSEVSFQRKIHIAQLEKANGLELSYPELDLPKVKIVRNPNGFDWMPWVAVGFPGEGALNTFKDGYCGCQTYAATRKGCVRKARGRLWQIALAKSENGQEVSSL